MAIDDLLGMETGQQIDADLCIIGAGAAGITIAHALAGSGLTICLLESGGTSPEEDTQSLYEAAVTGHDMTTDVGRYRILGGSTSQWTGRCARFDPIDFAERDWVPYSGWPIDHAEIDPYYEQARVICGFPAPWIDDHEAQRGLGVEPVKRPDLETFVWRYAPIGNRLYRNWGVEYRDALERSSETRLILHANVVGWEASENGDHVVAVEARALNGNQVRVAARAFALCAGGLENARLLLASADTVPGGIGSAQDMIGRFFMQHPRGVIGKLETSPATALALQDRYNIFQVTHGLQYEVGLALSEAAQREHGLLNASAILTYEADPDSGWEATKRLIGASEDGSRRAGDIGRVIRDPGSSARNLWRRGVRKRHSSFPVSAINVLIDLEQRPDPESRITLSEDRDRLGMRKASVDWRLAEQERHTAAVFADILQRFFGETGVGAMRAEPWLRETGPIGDELAGTYHHISTLRMSSGPESGVVDADCKVHGTDNLFVAGCAVFPTGGHANPTFTIIALALRLADQLRSRLAGKPAPPSVQATHLNSESMPV